MTNVLPSGSSGVGAQQWARWDENPFTGIPIPGTYKTFLRGMKGNLSPTGAGGGGGALGETQIGEGGELIVTARVSETAVNFYFAVNPDQKRNLYNNLGTLLGDKFSDGQIKKFYPTSSNKKIRLGAISKHSPILFRIVMEPSQYPAHNRAL